MKQLIAAALLAAAYPVTSTFDGMPPPRLWADRAVEIRYVADLNAPAACGTPPVGFVFAACVRSGVTFLPNPCAYGKTETFARLACHELAHRNGWPAKHGP